MLCAPPDAPTLGAVVPAAQAGRSSRTSQPVPPSAVCNNEAFYSSVCGTATCKDPAFSAL